MHLLLSNDDGFQADGLRILARVLSDLAAITIVAPNRNRSAASNSLTLERPLRAAEFQPGWYTVDGTPTDCVHLGITGLLENEPNMVVSGINAGANMGDDVIYSGTVAAAMEGRFLGLPAVAVSITSFQPEYIEDAAAVTRALVKQIIDKPFPEDVILNVNIPNVPREEMQGFATTRLGNRHKAEPAIMMHDPRGKPIFWVGAAGPEQDAGPGTDFHAINNNYISVTPLHVDLTRYNAMDAVKGWLDDCNVNK